MVGLVGLWGKSKFDTELKRSHPAVWDNMAGKGILANAMCLEFKWIGFLVLRSYNKLGNHRLSVFGNLLLACGLVNVAILIAGAFIPHGPGPTLD